MAAQLQLQLGDVRRQQDVEGRQEVVVAALVHKGRRLDGRGAGSGQLIGRRSPVLSPPGVTDLWLDVDVAWRGLQPIGLLRDQLTITARLHELQAAALAALVDHLTGHTTWPPSARMMSLQADWRNCLIDSTECKGRAAAAGFCK